MYINKLHERNELKQRNWFLTVLFVILLPNRTFGSNKIPSYYYRWQTFISINDHVEIEHEGAFMAYDKQWIDVENC